MRREIRDTRHETRGARHEARDTRREARGARREREAIGSQRFHLSSLFLPLLLFVPAIAHAQEGYATPDTIASVVYGEGGGRGSDYLPGNVLGLPDTIGRTEVATTDPKQILSLGLEGEIVLRFDRVYIVDRPGIDFTVFENPFKHRLGGKDKLYAEPGEVAVSRDGVEYIPYPYDPLTLEGCAGVTPTQGNQPPDDPSVSGGDGFDLADLGIDSIRFIRIRDITRMVKGNPEHPNYDITLNGFDLDAIIAINIVSTTASSVRDLAEIDGVGIRVPSILSGSDVPLDLLLPTSSLVHVQLLDATGKVLQSIEERIEVGGERLRINADGLPSGAYFLTISADGLGRTTRMIRILR